MQIRELNIKGWMGIENQSLKLGSVTILSGHNGSCKSSVLDAIKALLSHEHDPSRIRKGEKAATVELKLDNGHTYKMKTGDKSTTWDFKDENGLPIRRTSELLASIVNTLSLDPLAFIEMTPKEQVKIFTEAVAVKVTQEQLDVPSRYTFGIDFNQHALNVLGDDNSGVIGRLFQERTLVNRELKNQKAYLQELSKAVESMETPEGFDSWRALEEKLRDDLRELDSQRTLIVTSIKNSASGRIEDIKRNAEIRIEAIRQEMSSAISAVGESFSAQNNELSAKIGEAKARADSETQALASRKMADATAAKIKAAETTADQLTDYIEKTRELKSKLVSVSPIPGLETSPAGLVYEGVDYNVLNLAKRIDIAISISELGVGDLGLIIVDNLEHLDIANYGELVKAMKQVAKDKGLQFVGAKVANGELQVNSDDDIPF
jgi:predicted ATP-dependent endonuclease of OLD family